MPFSQSQNFGMLIQQQRQIGGARGQRTIFSWGVINGAMDLRQHQCWPKSEKPVCNDSTCEKRPQA